MSSDGHCAIRVEHLSKRYFLNPREPLSVKSLVIRFPTALRRGVLSRPFWALQDVSLEVQRGEFLGIIGPNGSGKTTLLRIMAHIAAPTRGRVVVDGRVSALLELGSGFHPDSTGRENAFVNAVLLGLSRREAEERMPLIHEFSGLGSFIDQPMRTYSQGMYVRLGFSVAVHVDAEILLVDEVLAVGDAAFQQRCYQHVESLRDRGVTVVIVTHDLATLESYADRVILLEDGEVAVDGDPAPVIGEYLSRTHLGEGRARIDRGHR